jgi:hypothetical protein
MKFINIKGEPNGDGFFVQMDKSNNYKLFDQKCENKYHVVIMQNLNQFFFKDNLLAILF